MFGRSGLHHLFLKTYAISIIMRTGKSASDFQEGNLVTSIDANSDDVHYPSAKCIYDIVYGEK